MFDSIEFQSQHRAVNQLDQHRKTFIKHINDYTPVGTRAHRNNPKYPKECLTCGAPEEDAPHLLTCPQRRQWRKTCLAALLNHFTAKDGQWDSPLELQELLMEGANAVMEGRCPSTIVPLQCITLLRPKQLLGGKTSLEADLPWHGDLITPTG